MIDDYGSEAERREARESDTEKNWEALAEDPHWHPGPGVGGFTFLGAVGFRYYLAPAMVKEIHGYDVIGTTLEDVLFLPRTFFRRYTLEKFSELRPDEMQCVCQFLKCMIALNFEAERSETGAICSWFGDWRKTYLSYLHSVDHSPLDL